MKSYVLSLALLLPTAGYASHTAVIDQFECRWSDLRDEWHRWDQCACRMFDKKLDCKHEIKKLRALIDSTITIAQKQNRAGLFGVIGGLKMICGYAIACEARTYFSEGVGVGVVLSGLLDFWSAVAAHDNSPELDRLIELRKRIDRFLNTIE
jgi:hypothetical protein